MLYKDYLSKTEQAAFMSKYAEVTSLAGGFYGVRFTVDGGYVLAALDLDDDTGWWCWQEDADGERKCECNHRIGWCPDNELEYLAVEAVVRHRHQTPSED